MFFLDIADIVWSISGDVSENSMGLDEAYRIFFGSGKPEITLRVHNWGLPQIHWQELERVFDSEMVWSLYKKEDEYIFALKSPVIRPSPYSIAVFNRDFTLGDIFCTPLDKGNGQKEMPLTPLAYPLAEALMVCLLAQGRGVMIHASGVVDEGRGYLFVGRSTHGKSTMAKLWNQKSVILNDDRIIVRYKDERFWIYGTPWHGEYNVVSSAKAPLEKIFVISHGEKNHVRKITGTEAVSMLLTRCFPPLWDKKGMDFTVGFYAKMVRTIACYSLKFKPDENVVDFVRCVN